MGTVDQGYGDVIHEIINLKGDERAIYSVVEAALASGDGEGAANTLRYGRRFDARLGGGDVCGWKGRIVAVQEEAPVAREVHDQNLPDISINSMMVHYDMCWSK